MLYKATSQEQMAAAMVSLQQFERQHRSAAAARRKASEDSADDPDQAFRKMAMSEPDYRLGIDNEIHAPMDALHEEIYFGTIEFFDILGRNAMTTETLPHAWAIS